MASEEGEGVPGENFLRKTRSGREFGAFSWDLGRQTGPAVENPEFLEGLAGLGHNRHFSENPTPHELGSAEMDFANRGG